MQSSVMVGILAVLASLAGRFLLSSAALRLRALDVDADVDVWLGNRGASVVVNMGC